MNDEQIISQIDAATRDVYALDPVANHFGLSVESRVPYTFINEQDFPEDAFVFWTCGDYVLLRRFNKIIAGTVLSWMGEK